MTRHLILWRSWRPSQAVVTFPRTRSGKIKLTVVSKHGKEAIVAILGKDEFFGEGCLIGQPKRLATAVAISECVTMRVDKAEITRVLGEEPLFSKMFVSHILARSARN
jgi:CRP/FNR family transcriptional regulator, cyclic AMP receptor protein